MDENKKGQQSSIQNYTGNKNLPTDGIFTHIMANTWNIMWPHFAKELPRPCKCMLKMTESWMKQKIQLKLYNVKEVLYTSNHSNAWVSTFLFHVSQSTNGTNWESREWNKCPVFHLLPSTYHLPFLLRNFKTCSHGLTFVYILLGWLVTFLLQLVSFLTQHDCGTE